MSFAAKLDPILDKYTSDKVENPLPVAIAALVTKDSGLVYLGAAGYKDAGTKHLKADVDTSLAFYSTSKAVTTTALLQLLEKGLIQDLDDPVEKYTPLIKSIKLLRGFDGSGNPVLVEPKTKPTIRHLLTHTAGFSYSFFSNEYAKLLEDTGSPNIFTFRWKEFVQPLIFEPGTKWHYGCNIDWVGKVIQDVSGLSLDAYFKKHIFEPLGATSLTFVREPQDHDNAAEIHQRKENTRGDLVALKNIHPEVPEFHCGGHGLFGRLADYMKFLEIFLHQGKSPSTGAQILKPETVENYSFANLLPEGVQVGPNLDFPLPNLSNKVSSLEEVPGDALAWTASFQRIDLDLPTGRSSGSFTWSGLPNLFYWIDPKKGVAGMFNTQLFPFYDKTALEGAAEFETAAYSLIEKSNL